MDGYFMILKDLLLYDFVDDYTFISVVQDGSEVVCGDWECVGNSDFAEVQVLYFSWYLGVNFMRVVIRDSRKRGFHHES